MGLTRVIVFYAGLLYDEYPTWQRAATLPDGAYIFDTDKKGGGQWYIVNFASAMPINLCDVPKELRTWVLILT